MTFKDAHNAADQSVKPDQLSEVIKSEHSITPETSSEYPSMGRVAIIMYSIYIAMFLIALDKTILGLVIFMPSIICLLLALQWGGTTYAWSSWRIILLLVTFPLLFGAFLFTFPSQAAMLVVTYYIPLFFQAIKSFSALGSVIAGGLAQRIGYPAPFMIASAILGSIGAGLISTWHVNVSKSTWIGFQVLCGFGIGIGMQQPTMMAQIVLPKADQPTGVALMFFGQNLGGAIFVSVAQSVFTDRLASKLSSIPGLELSKAAIVQMGATSIKKMVAEQYLGSVLDGYRDTLRSAFLVGAGLVAVSMTGAVLVEWRSTRTLPQVPRKSKRGRVKTQSEREDKI
ncbi:hypothetical protein E8E11_004187 [Didymella keratinophila]|nr:hypothetical protein E8E11_004187 [Didymella keratinophila]